MTWNNSDYQNAAKQIVDSLIDEGIEQVDIRQIDEVAKHLFSDSIYIPEHLLRHVKLAASKERVPIT